MVFYNQCTTLHYIGAMHCITAMHYILRDTNIHAKNLVMQTFEATRNSISGETWNNKQKVRTARCARAARHVEHNDAMSTNFRLQKKLYAFRRLVNMCTLTSYAPRLRVTIPEHRAIRA